jgi:hypothetical protein
MPRVSSGSAFNWRSSPARAGIAAKTGSMPETIASRASAWVGIKSKIGAGSLAT